MAVLFKQPIQTLQILDLRLRNAICPALLGGGTVPTMGLCPVPQPNLIFSLYLYREGQAHRAPHFAPSRPSTAQIAWQ